MDSKEFNNISFSYISSKEKHDLKRKIDNSIFKYKLKNNIIKYGAVAAAASVVLLFSIRTFNNAKINSSEVKKYAQKDSQDFSLIKNTSIALNDRIITIKEKKSTITHSKNGNELFINDIESVTLKNKESAALNYSTLIVPYGKKSTVTLSDGSKVWLNSGSKLTYPNSFTSNKRDVYLEGEAIFDVTHDKKRPFTVKSNNHNITVLGTIFNVSNYPEENSIRTTLKEGKIKVDYKENSFFNSTESSIILPGTQSVYSRSKNSFNIEKVNVEKYFSWREDVLIFKRDPLSRVMKKISRHYNLQVIITNKNLAEESFSGKLNIKGDVKKVLNTIKEATGFEYKLTDKKLIISK
jgi:hypothetical protein